MGELTQQFNPRSLQPQRWDAPFSVEMTTDTVARVMQYPPFSEMDPAGFPPRLPLQGILKNCKELNELKSTSRGKIKLSVDVDPFNLL